MDPTGEDFAGFMADASREAPTSEATARQFIGDDIVSIVRDPRRDRQRRAAEDEHLKSPLVREILNYLADKSLTETQAIRDTIVGGVWTTLYEIRAKKSVRTSEDT